MLSILFHLLTKEIKCHVIDFSTFFGGRGVFILIGAIRLLFKASGGPAGGWVRPGCNALGPSRSASQSKLVVSPCLVATASSVIWSPPPTVSSLSYGPVARIKVLCSVSSTSSNRGNEHWKKVYVFLRFFNEFNFLYRSEPIWLDKYGFYFHFLGRGNCQNKQKENEINHCIIFLRPRKVTWLRCKVQTSTVTYCGNFPATRHRVRNVSLTLPHNCTRMLLSW